MIGLLLDGSVIDLTAINHANLNIVAITNPTYVDRVDFELSGTRNYVDSESVTPYALFGDDEQGDFAAVHLSVGTYNVQADVYLASILCASDTIDFTVVDTSNATPEVTPEPLPIAITQFLLVNADNDMIIGTLTDGAVIDTSVPGTRSLNIIAEATGAESVIFTGDFPRNENSAPYTIGGDNNGDYYGITMQNGTYSITAIAYTEDNGRGIASVPVTLNFTIMGN